MTADGTPGAKNQPQYLGSGAPATAADMNTLANYAALVGNLKEGTAAERAALTGADVWDGLVFVETDNRRMYMKHSGGWDFIGGRTLPDPSAISGSASVDVTATDWASLSGVFLVLDLPADCWVKIDAGAWLVCTGGTDVRASFRVTGATTIGELANNWGQVMYTSSSDSDGSVQRSISKTVKLLAGENTIQMRAQQAGGGTKQVNYASLQATPLRWAV